MQMAPRTPAPPAPRPPAVTVTSPGQRFVTEGKRWERCCRGRAVQDPAWSMPAAQALTPRYFLGVFCTGPQILPCCLVAPIRPPLELLLLQGTSPVGTAMQEGTGCRMLPWHCQPPQALGAPRASEPEQQLQLPILHLYPLDFPPPKGFRPMFLQQTVPDARAGAGGAPLGAHHCAHSPAAPGGLW